MAEENIKSALIFYSIDDDSIFNLSVKDIWVDFIESKVEGVSCNNVYHSELTPDELLSVVKSKDISSEIFAYIKSECDLGANVMFVNPIVGTPIDGFLLHEFFSH